MSLDPPTYLSSLQNNIRARPIPWEGAVRAGHITDHDLQKIKAVDKVRKEQRRQTVTADVDPYTSLILGDDQHRSVFESAGKRGDVIQYILVLTGDLVEDIPQLTTSLLSHPRPYRPFLQLLKQSPNPEDPIPLLTASVLTCLMSNALVATNKALPETYEALPKLYSYLGSLSDRSDSGLQDIAVQAYSAVLRSKRSRELFWKQRSEVVGPLISILRAAAGIGRNGDSEQLWNGGVSVRGVSDIGLGGGIGIQLLYHVLLVMWQLSFEGALVGEGLQSDHDIIPLYTQLLRVSPKEKTTRLLISTLYNFLSTNRTTLLPVATLARLPALLQNLKGRHLTDPDLLEDLQNVSSMLDDYTKTQTTFDEYAAEVRSGHLRWSPPHRSALFWHDNARRIIESEKGELPKRLAEIMSKSWETDKQVLAVACNDVGCLVREVPELRARLEKLGLKTRVMALMAEEADESIRWEALRAVGEWLRYSFE